MAKDSKEDEVDVDDADSDEGKIAFDNNGTCSAGAGMFA